MDVLGNAISCLRDLSGSVVAQGEGVRGGEVNLGFGISEFGFRICIDYQCNWILLCEFISQNPQSEIRNPKCS